MYIGLCTYVCICLYIVVLGSLSLCYSRALFPLVLSPSFSFYFGLGGTLGLSGGLVML